VIILTDKKRNANETTTKKKIHMSKIIVPFVIVSIFTFTGLAMYVQIRSGVELSSTLIACFFAFCTGELWMLASIKKSKVKNNTSDLPIQDDPNTAVDESLLGEEEQTLDNVLEMIRQKRNSVMDEEEF
jgi:NhaP-type Na+/H+ or K+/H+ antiporter